MELDKSKVINLHQHSFFSVLDSPATLEDIVKSAKDYGRVAASLTDHGTIEGCVPFYVECKNQGIKPILGQEFYITPEGRKLTDRDPQLDKKRHHLLILAKNEKGYKNLCKLSSIANIEGMYYKPRIDFETLIKYKEGLIISSACYASQLSYYLSDEYAEEKSDGLEKAEKYLLKMKTEFGEDFYIEEVWLRPTGKENPTDYNIITGKKAEPIYIRQEKVNKKATELSKKLGIKRIMTLDAHYVKSEDSEIQDMLVAIGTGRDLDDNARLTFIDIDESILSPDEMIKEAEKRNDLDLVKNIIEIVDKIDINLSFVGERHIPIFPVPEEELKTFTEEQKKNPEKEYIRRQVFEGIKKRNYRNFNKTGKLDQKIIDRIQHELKVIDQMGFNGYHLIVADYNNWAKDNGVVCGPARGSAASSLVCYLLGITEVDPMEYEDLMLFMRYLNPHRVSMPDIDLDYSDRQKVEDYFREKWGHDKTAAISTTSYMRAKNAFKDVARTLRFDFKESNRIAGLIPDAEAKDRKKKRLPILLEENEELKKEASKNPEVGKIFNYAKKLEGTVRGHGVHACGVVIAPHALTDYMGLTVAKGKDGRIVTQADPADIEENYGLLKMDMLGLSNLTILEETIQKIKKEYGKDINIKDIPLDDEKTYKTYQDGNSYFTFQTNTSYLRQICKEFKPKNIRDLAWINAVCRPGPMSYIPEMLEIRQGKRKPTYICEAAKEIFEPLGGYPVFQESIMLFCMKACGFDEAEADNIRKAIGKSKPEILQECKDKVIKGYLKHTNPNQKKEIEEFWHTVEGFGRYAFNSSHAIAYSHISYWTCYFLTHYPEIYLASYMNNRADDRDEIAACINYCKKFGIKVKTPDINYSTRNFRADPENHTIYYGLSKIKGLGASAWDIVVERNANGEYKSIEDLIERIPRRTLNSGKLTALLYGGALDSFVKGKRSILDASYENILEYQNNYFKNSSKKSKVSKNQIALFDELFEDNANKVHLVIPEEFTEDMKINLLLKEKEYLGEYITASPLDSYKRNEGWINELERDKKKKEEFESQGSRYYGENVQKIIGIVQSIKALTTKKGDRMAIVQLDCNENNVELVVFPKVYADLRKIPKTGNIVMFSGSYNEGNYESGYKMFAESLKIIR